MVKEENTCHQEECGELGRETTGENEGVQSIKARYLEMIGEGEEEEKSEAIQKERRKLLEILQEVLEGSRFLIDKSRKIQKDQNQRKPRERRNKLAKQLMKKREEELAREFGKFREFLMEKRQRDSFLIEEPARFKLSLK